MGPQKALQVEGFFHLMYLVSAHYLVSEEDELEFIKAFRDLMRLKNTMTTFANFDWEDLEMPEQLFNDYRSKYLDLW